MIKKRVCEICEDEDAPAKYVEGHLLCDFHTAKAHIETERFMKEYIERRRKALSESTG